jgi:site-specific recombinase XerD
MITSGALVPASPQPTHADTAPVVEAIADWLLGYTSAHTRLSYGDALGLDRDWVRRLTDRTGEPTSGHRQPPTRTGKYRHLAWLRWCDTERVHPLRVTAIDVKRWQADMAAAGMPKTTRGHRLGVVAQFYRHLVEHDVVNANPADFDRRGLGLRTAGDTSSTVVLTAAQVARLLRAAGTQRRGVSPLMALRSTAIVAVFTLGVRVAELTGLTRADPHLTHGRRALRVTGKGDKTRVVYMSRLAADAVDAYLAERDRAGNTATPAPRGRVTAGDTPLIATRDGGAMHPGDVWALIRRLAHAAGPLLADVADRMGPHALRHFYVTAGAEGGADMTHIQADVGHASVDTTNRVYNRAARHPDRSAVDIVEAALLAAPAADPNDVLTGLRTEDPIEHILALQRIEQLPTPNAAIRRAVADLLARTDLDPRVEQIAHRVRRSLS